MFAKLKYIKIFKLFQMIYEWVLRVNMIMRDAFHYDEWHICVS